MKIWILNHYASAPDKAAGTRHYEFGRLFAGQGHEVTIFASSYSHFTRAEERLSGRRMMRVEWVDGVRFVWLRTVPYTGNGIPRVLNMLSYAAVVSLAQFRFARPDVVVGSSVHLAAVAAAWVIGWLRRAPFVFEVRDLWPQTLIDIGALAERSITARVLAWMELFLYRRARAVVSLLPGASDYIVGRGIASAKISYIPNGIAPGPPAVSSIARGTEELLARIARWHRAGMTVAGYVGSHGRANGLDTLVRAADELQARGERGFAFVFVGEGPEKAACQRLAAECGLTNVLFWPAVAKQEVPAVLAALDVLLFCLRDVPVFRYGLSSNKLFDYLASGRPVVAACAVTGNPVAASGAGVCVPPEAPGAVAEALLDVAALGAAGRAVLGQRGQQWVSEHHHSTVLASRFLDVLTGARG
jgi:glycosyltransferase involved in cell wall biosynthesis